MAIDVLGIIVSIGIMEPLLFQTVEKKIMVVQNMVEEAMRRLMGGGEEAVGHALAVKARSAMQEGGSSHRNLLD
jgi:hypothetical protein